MTDLNVSKFSKSQENFTSDHLELSFKRPLFSSHSIFLAANTIGRNFKGSRF